MALRHLTMKLGDLRCIAQSEGSSGSEPYLWITYFGFGAEPLPGQAGIVPTNTPAYDAFRTEFPDGVKAGQAAPVPAFLAEGSFEIDLDADRHQRVGCIAVLMEEDSTPQSSIVLGRIAYAKEIEVQLNKLFNHRIQTNDDGPITDDELKAIREAVKAKAEAAIGSNQSIWNFFRNQDDNLGFAYVAYDYATLSTLASSSSPTMAMDFDEMRNESGSDRFELSGSLSIAAQQGPTVVDLCASVRAPVTAKEREIKGLQTRRGVLQIELQNAAPGQKAAIVDEIEATNQAITIAEQELAPLQAALDDCIARRGGNLGGGNVGGNPPIGGPN